MHPGMSESIQPEDQTFERINAEHGLSKVLREHDLSRAVVDHLNELTRERQRLLRSIKQGIGDKWGEDNPGVLAYCAGQGYNNPIASSDIPAIGEALRALGDRDSINLLLESPGGDGVVAGKIARMCRCFADTFRVLVLNRAKSAATLIALSANQIVMGYCSEIGPIDAQVPFVAGQIPRYISAQTFIDAEEQLRTQYLERKEEGKEVQDILTSIAALDPELVEHCRRLMDFSRDLAEHFLRDYMLKDKYPSSQKLAGAVRRIINRLSLPLKHQVHSRAIYVEDAKDMGLEVVGLGKESNLWQDMWSYHDRAFVYMGTTGRVKLVETPSVTLGAAQATFDAQQEQDRD